MFGLKGNFKFDFILDLYIIIVNMGLIIILVNYYFFNLKIVIYLSLVELNLKIYICFNLEVENIFINFICECGFVIEVGSIV